MVVEGMKTRVGYDQWHPEMLTSATSADAALWASSGKALKALGGDPVVGPGSSGVVVGRVLV